ncbi:MAG: tRNA pseudouridine(38-40) synthase TruA [Clostridiales bacterium]|nr:tRNA pseudouridine(38-40) synthase TruA [Clostridiales bacterium]MDY3745924.1 tRNA pseudouridine(38-40) synthase TruA [Lachnospiraceae bacterium]
MRNIKLTIEYDGSRYDGWQRLGKNSGQMTIQGKIEEVLKKMTGEDIELDGSGRTDAGVHAYAQVANFHTNTTMKCYEIKHYLNRYLPRDIAVFEVEEVDERFHSRLNVKSKKYIYRIAIGEVPSVFDRKYTYYCFDRLDVAAMKKAAVYLIGRHDFKAFSSIKKTNKSTVREIYDIDIYNDGREIQITVHGSGFLYNMVRIIAGTLIEVGKGERKPEDMKCILDSRDREQAGVTAPAQGLFLLEVEY